MICHINSYNIVCHTSHELYLLRAPDLRACAPDRLRVLHLRARDRIYARRTLARMNARSSCARMTHHDPMEVARSASANDHE